MRWSIDGAQVDMLFSVVGLNVDPALLVRGGRLTEAQARDVRRFERISTRASITNCMNLDAIRETSRTG